MLEYLKSEISRRMAEQNPVEEPKQDEVDNSTILEYAKLFQELDDLSEKGTAIETAVRPPISIPLDDDIEIDSIEINLTDGRVTDIPADATVQEETVEDLDLELEKIEQQYAGMKSYKELYEEAYNAMERLPRESDERFEQRVHEQTDIAWMRYNEHLYQEGVFGHGKIEVNDLSVPDKIHMNFGRTSDKNSKDYSVTLPITWEVDKQKRITKKQLDSVHVWSKFGRTSLEKMSDQIFKHICDKYNVPDKKKKWDVLTPTIIAVPIDPADEYCIVIGFETDFSKNIEYWSLSIPVKAIDVKSSADVNVPDNAMGNVKSYANIEKKNMIRKRDYKLEQAEIAVIEKMEEERIIHEQYRAIEESMKPERHGRFWQEAIDFGNDAPDATAATGGTDAPPTADADAGATSIDAAAGGDTTLDAGGDTTTDVNAGGDETTTPDAEDANVNDVSDQIADKVSQTTDDQTSDDLNIDTTDTSTEPEDVNKDDLDNEIDNLGSDTPENTDTTTDENLGTDNQDLDNMTIDELLAEGSEKLKGMTLAQLKSFINSPDGTTPDDVKNEDTGDISSDIQEAYVMESKKDNGNRTLNALEKVIARLNYIHKGIKSGWTDADVKKCFVPVKTGTSGRPAHMKYRTTESEYFKKELMDLASFIKSICKRTDIDRSKVSEFKKFIMDLKEYIKLCTKELDKNNTNIGDIDDMTLDLIETAEHLRGLIPADMKSKPVEEYAYSEEDEKVMMEYFFTDASNIRKRIKVAIEDVIPGLEKIKNNCGNGKWDRYKFREFWRDVPDETSLQGMGGERHGTQFRSYIADLQHFLKISNKKRARDIFTESQLSDINDCIVRLDGFSRLCDKASKTIYIKEDVSMSELSDWAKMAIESCKHIKKIVESEEFAEFYIQEAALTTKKNINQKMLSHIKITLGILNNTENSFQELVTAFKKESKALNKILNKAARMDGMYSEAERKEIKKMNILLMDLSSDIRMNNLNDSYTNRIKSDIKAYANQCKKVSDIIEQHIGMSSPSKLDNTETVNESFTSFLESCDNCNAYPQDNSDVVQEAGGASPALMNVKNQIQNSVGDEFEIGGGGYVPKFTLKSKLVPPVSISVSEQGKNLEVTPEYNNVPDFANKRRGIAINNAAKTILDFARSVVNNYKSKNAATVKEDDTSTADISSGTTTTADTTTGDDVSTPSGSVDNSSQMSDTSSPDMSTSPASGSVDSSAETSSVNECGEIDVAKKFEEFMNLY